MVFLTPFMFERPNAASDPPPFGLTCGQLRDQAVVVPYAVWYRGQGDRLGYGHVSGPDCLKISQDLAKDQAFLIFRGTNALKPGVPLPREMAARIDPKDLYEVMPWEVLSTRASFVIIRGGMYIVDDGSRSRFVLGELSFKSLNFKGLRGLIG